MGVTYWVRERLGLFALLAVGCAPQDGPVLMWEEYEAPNGVEERHTGSGCADVHTSSGMSTSFAGGANLAESVPPHSIDWIGDTESVTVTIKDQGGQVLDTNRYSESFLLGRQEDELRADFPNGYLRLKVWGREVCEELRTPAGE